jgi:hypothetical protein
MSVSLDACLSIFRHCAWSRLSHVRLEWIRYWLVLHLRCMIHAYDRRGTLKDTQILPPPPSHSFDIEDLERVHGLGSEWRRHIGSPAHQTAPSCQPYVRSTLFHTLTPSFHFLIFHEAQLVGSAPGWDGNALVTVS